MLVTLPGTAHAFDWSVKVEPGFAMPAASPQSELFKLGGAGTVKVLFGLGPYVDVGPTLGLVGLPASSSNPSSTSGIGWHLGGGFRFKRPHNNAGRGLGAVSPWLDVDALYVRTGSLNRFGFSVGAGFAFPLGAERRFWLGPFVRYLHIVQAVRDGFDNRDAKIVIVGLSLEFGSAHRPPVALQPASCPACPGCAACPAGFRCLRAVDCRSSGRLPDRDVDGVPDQFDRCPDVTGPYKNQGCPPYAKIVVHMDRLELKERIQFAWNMSTIERVSYPLLDEVVKALNDNKSFNVRIQGHASSDGPSERNQTLSENRAKAVLKYLVDHGVAKARLKYKGFGEAKSTKTNSTRKGRVANRRVVFKVDLIILKK